MGNNPRGLKMKYRRARGAHEEGAEITDPQDYFRELIDDRYDEF